MRSRMFVQWRLCFCCALQECFRANELLNLLICVALGMNKSTLKQRMERVELVSAPNDASE